MTTTASLRAAHDTLPKLADLQGAIKRMRRRVQAAHAQKHSLERAAEGTRWIHQQLTSILELRVARHGWTTKNRLAQSTLQAMEQQLQVLAPADYDLPLKKLQLSLDHALFRAGDTLTLMREENGV